jgi:3-hydroxy acid dehydrogenase / malonic semialdehyde reductase
MNRLKNKTAIITGATSGIGKACAILLASMDVNLVLCGRRKERLQYFKDELVRDNKNISITLLNFDVTQKKDVNENLVPVLEKHSIDILINNAGLALGIEKIDEGEIENWETMIDTDIKGLLYVSRIVIPHMKHRNKGHIINLGSIAGCIAYPGGNVYCATKAAVHALNDSMNADLLGTSIRVSSIAPGAVDTEFSDIRFKGNKAKRDAVYKGYTALTAQDIADLIVYILNTPEHVNIQHSVIMPTAQRNPYLLSRE